MISYYTTVLLVSSVYSTRLRARLPLTEELHITTMNLSFATRRHPSFRLFTRLLHSSPFVIYSPCGTFIDNVLSPFTEPLVIVNIVVSSFFYGMNNVVVCLSVF